MINMIISRKQIRKGEILPPWYYGLTYEDFYRAVEVYHPIPINYIISFGMTIKIYWNRFRKRRTWIDKQISAGILDYINKQDYNIEKEIKRRIILAIKLNFKKSANKRMQADNQPSTRLVNR